MKADPADKRWLCVDLPLVEYDKALNLQERLVAAKNSGIMQKEVVVLLEHPSVFTLGRRGGSENLTVSPSFLEKQNIPIVQSERGGNITFHGPGQLVVYPVIDLDGIGMDITVLVDTLEEIMLRVAADCGVQAERNTMNRGIWVENKKLGSIGISVRRGVSFHGFSLNVNLSLEPFNWINPCGLRNIGVTSMARESSQKVSMQRVRQAVKFHLGSCFGVELLPVDPTELQDLLRINPKTMVFKESNMPTDKPSWIRQRVLPNAAYEKVKDLLDRDGLHSVCQEALCPNLWECFSRKTATLLIMGNRCTRNCAFCAVTHGPGEQLDPNEPSRVAEAAQHLRLRYVVITSVTRDDLPDGGAGHFAQTIKEIRRKTSETRIEVLIPDFQGDAKALRTLITARPDVLNHNLETVSSLYQIVRPEAVYRRSLELLKRIRDYDPRMITKSGLMLGLGETSEEIRATLRDLLDAGCKLLTLGQYLQPTPDHLPVQRFVHPDEFDFWKETALKMGFGGAVSGPFIRSSYQAEKLYRGVAI